MQFKGQRSCGSKDKWHAVQRTKVMQLKGQRSCSSEDKGHAVQKTKVMQFKGQRSKPEGCTNTEYSFTRELKAGSYRSVYKNIHVMGMVGMAAQKGGVTRSAQGFKRHMGITNGGQSTA